MLHRRILPVALLLSVTACGSRWTSNAVDLPATSGVPVEVRGVKMRHTLAVGLGSTPVRLSSRTDANAIGIVYDIAVADAAAPHADVAAQLVCLVGDHAVRSRLAHDASNRLATATTGSVVEGSTVLFPTAFQTEIPTVCEAELLYRVRPPLTSIPPIGGPFTPPEPPPPAVSMGTVCLSGGELREGRCTADELPRTPADAPVEISGVDARIGPLAGDSTFGVGISVMLTAGADVPPHWRVLSHARCDVAGQSREITLPLFLDMRDLPPGESTTAASSTPPHVGVATAPSACELSFELDIDGARSSLGTYCVVGEHTVAGDCAPPLLHARLDR